jgi:hypothetical protein
MRSCKPKTSISPTRARNMLKPSAERAQELKSSARARSNYGKNFGRNTSPVPNLDLNEVYL